MSLLRRRRPDRPSAPAGRTPLSGAIAVLAAGAGVVAGRLAGARHERLRVAREIEGADTLLVVLDAHGRIRVASRRACAVLGRPAARLRGRDWFEVVVPAEDRERSRAVAAVETELRDPAGATRVVEWTGAPVLDGGRVAGALWSGADVTERRAAEAQVVSDLAGLRRLAQDVASLDDARAAVAQRVAELTGATFGALFEPAAGGTKLVVTASTLDRLAGESVTVGGEASGAATAYVEGRTLFASDGASAPALSRRLLAASEARSIVFQPVGVAGQSLGVLVVGWSEPVDALGTRRTELVELAADEAAIALQRLAAMRRLEAAALRDPLTGVANRRAFEQALPVEVSRALRSGAPLALAYMDLNEFKALNDTRGHEAGDRALKEVAAAWQGALRHTDILARVGGDEFAVLLPDCDERDIGTVAERLRSAVTHAPGCGVGIAVWDGEESPEELVRRADEALYADKALGGRPRITDAARLAALEATGLLDAPSAPELDELTRVAAWLLGVRTVVVSLVDDRRQFFAAECGLPAGPAADERGTPLAHSLCQHAVAAGRPLVVEDARRSPLVRDSPGLAALQIVAYAGIPLVDPAGNTIGVLCATDGEPRRWSEDDVATLRILARRAIEQIARRTAAGARAA